VPVSHSVEARAEQFEPGDDGLVRRSNEIWRATTDRRSGDVVATELVRRNRAVVKYAVGLSGDDATA
jgi:vancomycin resistance protein VanW